MAKCSRCGKEIEEYEGGYCQECFSQIINETKNGLTPKKSIEEKKAARSTFFAVLIFIAIITFFVIIGAHYMSCEEFLAGSIVELITYLPIIVIGALVGGIAPRKSKRINGGLEIGMYIIILLVVLGFSIFAIVKVFN